MRELPPAQWPAALADRRQQRPRIEIHPQLWDFFAAQYLTRRAPDFRAVYRRMCEIADAQRLSVPSEYTVRRILDERIDPWKQIAARDGIVAAIRRLPTPRRDETVFEAGQAVTGDGLKLDTIYVRFEDGEVLNTATIWVWADIRTRRLLACRLGKTESTDLFRLATYDLLGQCVPELVYVDNTRVAANRLMTGGTQRRHRFAAGDDSFVGLLPLLGIHVQFTNPDVETGHPGAKPIERTFRCLHREIASHPLLINRGYSIATAVPAADLRAVIEQEIARWNARNGRRTREANGDSFDAAWARLRAAAPVQRRVTDAQRRLLLLSREIVRVSDAPFAVRIAAGRSTVDRNTYTSDELCRYAGQRVAAYYDPDALHDGVWLYDEGGRFLCGCHHVGTRAFNDKASGDEVARARKRIKQHLSRALVQEHRIAAKEAAQLYAGAVPLADPPAPVAPAPNVISARFRRVPSPTDDASDRDLRLAAYLARCAETI